MSSIARSMRLEDVDVIVPPETLGPQFAGVPTVRLASVALGTDETHVNAVYFEAGGRNQPHTHTNDQILLYLEGTGVIALDGGEDQVIPNGEIVLLPGGVPHMHGATADGPAMHLSIMRDVDIDFDCVIPDSWSKWRLLASEDEANPSE